jgi:hypothetical protein
MRLPPSGTIILKQVLAKFGDNLAEPITEYYRNGKYVPGAIPSGEDKWIAHFARVEGPLFDFSANDFVRKNDDLIEWVQGPLVRRSATSAIFPQSLHYFVEREYQGVIGPAVGHTIKDAFFHIVPLNLEKTDATYSYYSYEIHHYNAQQIELRKAEFINQGVPTSGPISPNDFHGGRKA